MLRLCLMFLACSSVMSQSNTCEGETNEKLQGADQAGQLADSFSVAEDLGMDWLAGQREGETTLSGIAKDHTGANSDALKDYGMGLIPYAGAGIGLAVITLLIMLCVLPCRFLPFLRCKCCQANNHKELSVVQKKGPYLCWVIFSLAALVCAIVGAVAVKDMAVATIDSVGQIETTFTDASGFIDGLNTPVQDIKTQANTLFDEVEGILNGTGNIESKLTILTVAITDLANNASAPIDINGESVSAMDPANKQTLLDAISTNVAPVTTQIQGIKADMDSKLVAPKVLIKSLAAMAQEMANSSKTMIADTKASLLEGNFSVAIPMLTTKESYTGVKDLMCDVESNLLLVGSVFFVGVVVALVFMLIGFLLGAMIHRFCGLLCTRFSLFILLLWILLLFILAGVMMTTGVILYDACGVVEDVPQNVSLYLGSFMPAPENGTNKNIDLVQGCMGNPTVSAMVSLGLEKNLNIEDQLDLSQLDSMNTLPNDLAAGFQPFDDLDVEIRAYTPATFKINETEIEIFNKVKDCTSGAGWFAKFVAITTPGDATQEEYATYCDGGAGAGPWVAGSSTTCSGADPAIDVCFQMKNASETAHTALVAANATVTSFLSNIVVQLDNVATARQEFNASIMDVKGKVDQVRTKTGPLFAAVSNLTAAGNCAFVRKSYLGFHEQLCKKMLPKWMSMAVMMWFVGIFSYFVTIATFCINNRSFLHRFEDVEDPEFVSNPIGQNNDDKQLDMGGMNL